MIKKYGTSPFTVAVIHGGPGAAGYMAPVARELSKHQGVLEPWQSATSVQSQIDELRGQIASETDQPIMLVGSSWGAMLALLFTAQHQSIVSKLILVGCGTFTKADSNKVDATRMKRFTLSQREKLQSFLEKIEQVPVDQRSVLMKEFGKLFDHTDKYDPLSEEEELGNLDWSIFKNVWADFERLRNTEGYIHREFSKITVPVTLIQGDYDPHPAMEIYDFLKNCIPQITLHLLKNCGHYPWIEKQAKDEFYKILTR